MTLPDGGVRTGEQGPAGGGTALPREDRAAAFAAGPPRFPRRALYIGLAVIAALAIGGSLLERLLSSVGLNPKAPAAVRPAIETTGTLPEHPPGGRALAAFMGVQPLAPNRAPAIDLDAQSGTAFQLASERHKVVVLGFFDAACDDVCPVLGAELLRAQRDLGAKAAGVEFVVVNSDPRDSGFDPRPPALVRTGLATQANVAFLTGSLARLDAVWTSYGVAIQVSRSGMVAHNDPLYFIDPSGRLRYRASAYADESRAGTYHLSDALRARWATGIATYAASLEAGAG